MTTPKTAVETQTQPIDFPVWKTIKLGTGLRTAEDFKEAITKMGRVLWPVAYDILSHPSFVVANVQIEVDLVLVTSLDLGLHKTKGEEHLWGIELREETNRRALSQGLQLCPTEVAPQLRLQGDDKDYCMIVTDKLPFTAGKGHPTLGLGIMGMEQRPTLSSYAEDWTLPNLEWVFVKPRKQKEKWQ